MGLWERYVVPPLINLACGAKPIAYAYAWSRCDASGNSCTAILSARKATYKLAHEDVGHTLRAAVSASEDHLVAEVDQPSCTHGLAIAAAHLGLPA